jgi:DNA polymerase-1
MDLVCEESAWSYIEGFYRRFPNVKDFPYHEWEKMRKLPAQERMVRSLIGTERRFPRRPTAEIERQFRVTWTHQIEADLIKNAMLRLDRIFRRRNMKARIVMMIHDALWAEAPTDEQSQVRELMQFVMTNASDLAVHMQVEFD